MRDRFAKGTLVALALTVLVGSAGFAQTLTRQERKQAEKLFAGKLYLRIDAPCEIGRHPYGTYQSPLVEVSPEGANTEQGAGPNFGWFHAGSTSWKARINDQMELDELEWDDDDPTSVEVEIEGAGKAEGHDTTIRFVQIRSMADFQAAFDKAFSRVPLQDEHADWSPEIKKAISERRLLQGMTKRQAYYIVGMPAKVDKPAEEGKEVEVWTLQSQGLEIGFWTMKPGDTGPAKTLRFEDGALVSFDAAPAGEAALDLDD
jgi:hypothetical protein